MGTWRLVRFTSVDVSASLIRRTFHTTAPRDGIAGFLPCTAPHNAAGGEGWLMEDERLSTCCGKPESEVEGYCTGCRELATFEAAGSENDGVTPASTQEV